MYETITSKANPLIAHIKKLGAGRAYRRECGQFVCEGPKLLLEAVGSGAEISALLTVGDELPYELPRDARTVRVSEKLLRAVSSLDTPQGLIFVCRMPGTGVPDRLEGDRHLVIEGLQDPGNVGTIIRTADAFSMDGVILAGDCADPFNPKTVRATMGAIFRQRVIEADIEEIDRLVRGSGLPLYGAALSDGAADLRRLDLSRCAVAVGSEGAGLSDRILSICDRQIIIPMSGRCESLNAGVAAAVIMWEMAKGRLE